MIIRFYFFLLSEDIEISFSKKRYRASVQVTARPGTSVVTVRARAGISRVHYTILSVNSKPYNDKTSLFDMNPATGTAFTIICLAFSSFSQLILCNKHGAFTNAIQLTFFWYEQHPEFYKLLETQK